MDVAIKTNRMFPSYTMGELVEELKGNHLTDTMRKLIEKEIKNRESKK